MRLDPRVKEKLTKTFTEELIAQKEQVVIFSCIRLSQDELQKIINRFPQYAGNTIENKVDPSLIGGFIIQCGSQNIDLSIRNALHSLQIKLYESN